MNQIAKTRRPVVSNQHRELIQSWPSDVSALLNSRTPDGHLPATVTPTMQRNLAKMADTLETIFSDKRIADETATVTFLLSAMPGPSGVTAQATSVLFSAFEIALEGVPTWAVEEAGRRWICGLTGNGTFAPTPPQLRWSADEVVRMTRGKIFTLRQLATARINHAPTAAERENGAKVVSLIAWRDMPDTSPADERAARLAARRAEVLAARAAAPEYHEAAE